MMYRNKKNRKRNRIDYKRDPESIKKRLKEIFAINRDPKKRQSSSSKLPKPEGYPDKNIIIVKDGKSIYLWNKGHLKAKNLGGSDEINNLSTQTSWTNYLAYSENGDKRLNKECMKYYENMATTDEAVRYVVNAKVSPGEKIPRIINIFIDEKKYTINNYFPGLEIDYKTGEATVRPEYKDMITISTELEVKNGGESTVRPECKVITTNIPTKLEEKNGDGVTVYYKSRNAEVYWYSEERLHHQMKSSGSTNDIHSCSEREAKEKGLRLNDHNL